MMHFFIQTLPAEEYNLKLPVMHAMISLNVGALLYELHTT